MKFREQHFRVAAAAGARIKAIGVKWNKREVKPSNLPLWRDVCEICVELLERSLRNKKKFTNEKKKHYLWIKQDKFEQKAISKL